jgi:hypothetical protein
MHQACAALVVRVVRASSAGSGRLNGYRWCRRWRVLQGGSGVLAASASAAQSHPGNGWRQMPQRQDRLRQLVVDKRPVQAPTDNWWIPAASFLPVFETLATTFTVLQARNMVISQEPHERESLVGKFCSGIGARSSLDGLLEGLTRAPSCPMGIGGLRVIRFAIICMIRDRGYATCLSDLTILRSRKSSMRSDCLH